MRFLNARLTSSCQPLQALSLVNSIARADAYLHHAVNLLMNFATQPAPRPRARRLVWHGVIVP